MLLSCIFTVPEAAFLGLAKRGSPFNSLSLLILSNSFLGRKISPLTSNFSGIFPPLISIGMFLMVLIFSVTTSPLLPSPLVTARINLPFSYTRLMATPSNFNSQKYSKSLCPSPFTTLSSKANNSSSE